MQNNQKFSPSFVRKKKKVIPAVSYNNIRKSCLLIYVKQYCVAIGLNVISYLLVSVLRDIKEIFSDILIPRLCCKGANFISNKYTALIACVLKNMLI